MSVDVASRPVEVRNSSRKSSPAPTPLAGTSPHDDGTSMAPVSSSTSTIPIGPPLTAPTVTLTPEGARLSVPKPTTA